MAKTAGTTQKRSGTVSGAEVLNNWGGLLYVIIDSISSGLIAVNQEGLVCGYNKQAFNLLNIKNDQIYKQPIKDILPGSPLQSVLLSGKALYRKIENFGQNYLLGDHIPLYDSNQRLIGACSIYRKVTENAELYLEFRVLELMANYSCPGNVRELENLTERLVVTSSSEETDEEQLPKELKTEITMNKVSKGNLITLKKAKETLEKLLITQALERYRTTRKAAAALGVSQPTVVRKAKRYGLQISD